MRCGVAHAYWFFTGFFSPVFAKKIRRLWILGGLMIFQLVISIATLILGLVIFFLARKYEKHQP